MIEPLHSTQGARGRSHEPTLTRPKQSNDGGAHATPDMFYNQQ